VTASPARAMARWISASLRVMADSLGVTG
jgi:hypothetical protein